MDIYDESGSGAWVKWVITGQEPTDPETLGKLGFLAGLECKKDENLALGQEDRRFPEKYYYLGGRYKFLAIFSWHSDPESWSVSFFLFFWYFESILAIFRVIFCGSVSGSVLGQ